MLNKLFLDEKQMDTIVSANITQTNKDLIYGF
jgi:hypothetical protein